MQRLKPKRLLSCFLLIAILTFTFVNSTRCQNSQSGAEQAIAAAENQINTAFISVCVAEEAGATIEDLIDELNVALDLILTAQTNLLSGDISKATNLASDAMEITDTIKAQAEIRKQEALSMSFLQNYGTLIVFVIADLIICVIGVLIIHRWQHRSFAKKKLKLVR